MPTMPKRKRPAALTMVPPAALSSGWSILDNPGDGPRPFAVVPVSKPQDPYGTPPPGTIARQPMASQSFPLTPDYQSRMPVQPPQAAQNPAMVAQDTSGPTFVGTPGQLSPNQGFDMDPKGGSVRYDNIFGSGGPQTSSPGDAAPQGTGWSGAQGLSDFLINAGAATLENDGDIFKGAAGGIRGWQAAKRAREAQARADAQQQFENANATRRLDQADTGLQRQQDQFEQGQQNWDKSYGLQREQFDYNQKHDADVMASSEADKAEQRAIERARLAIARKTAENGTNGAWTSQILPTEDGGAVAVRVNKNTGETFSRVAGSEEWTPGIPQGVQAGLSMVSPQLREDQKFETTLSNQAVASMDQIDNMQRIAQLAKDNPDQFGPSWQAGITRYLTQAFGLDGTEGAQEVMRLASSGELNAAMGQRGLGQLTEGEREIIRRSLVDPRSVDAKAAGPIIEKLIKRAQEDIDTYDKYLTTNPQKREGARGFSFTQRLEQRKKEGGAQSGASPMNKTSSGVSWRIVQ